MWLMLGLFAGAGATAVGLWPLGVAGLAIGVICQISERKDEETWQQVQNTPVASVYPILSVIAALMVAAICFAILGIGLEMTMR